MNETTKKPIDFSQRHRQIGGSEIAAIMGMSKYDTPLSLWARKTGKLNDELANFEAAEIGAELEEYVARKFTRKTGIKLRVDNRTFQHPDFPYMICHIDRWVVGEDSIFEAKTASAWLEKEWRGNDIPDGYVLQCVWGMGLTKKKLAHIAVLIGGQKFLYKTIEFDGELFDRMVEAARNFMEEHVLKDAAPFAIEGDSETLIRLFPESTPTTIKLDGVAAEELDGLVEDRLGGLESIRHAKEELEKIEARIKQICGENEAVETPSSRVTWKTKLVKEYVVKAFSKRVLNAKLKKEKV